ncbi:unnamed protein product [Sphagnum troendelagicum]|uniref:Uncharacterized protein n=1 Tax=Sphagnum troendelagicum TaxID=128251 RepID=A0ABP0U605_9BRYO
MTFYKGLPLIGKDTPTIEPTGTNVHENTLLFLRGSEFPGQSLTSAPHWSFILTGHCICYATYINFQVSLYHFISLVSQAKGVNLLMGYALRHVATHVNRNQCTIVENASCSIINLNRICICFWCSSNGHCRGLFCGQLMQLDPCMGYKSGHHSLQCMLF